MHSCLRVSWDQRNFTAKEIQAFVRSEVLTKFQRAHVFIVISNVMINYLLLYFILVG